VTTLFAGVDLVHAASPRAETAIMVRAIFFTDNFLRMVASGCEENPLFAGRGAERAAQAPPQAPQQPTVLS
jgi:hypothetical protein